MDPSATPPGEAPPRRRDDAQYVRSALGTLVFYGALLALLWLAGTYLRWGALAGLGAILLWLYRGDLFGLTRWPAKRDVRALLEHEREALARRSGPHPSASPGPSPGLSPSPGLRPSQSPGPSPGATPQLERLVS